MRGGFVVKLARGAKGSRAVKQGMGDTESLTKALEKFAELITVKGDEATSSGGGAIVPHTEAVPKLELMPNDIKLEGVTNYLRWSRRALLILNTKGLDESVKGEAVEPPDKTSSEWKKWSATSSLITELSCPNIAAHIEALA